MTRLAYPVWLKFKNTDDLSEEEEDYLKYREELVTNIFSNIANIPLFKNTVLQMLSEALLALKPGQNSPNEAEVILFCLYNLQVTIPANLRETISEQNLYSQLML